MAEVERCQPCGFWTRYGSKCSLCGRWVCPVCFAKHGSCDNTVGGRWRREDADVAVQGGER